MDITYIFFKSLSLQKQTIVVFRKGVLVNKDEK